MTLRQWLILKIFPFYRWVPYPPHCLIFLGMGCECHTLMALGTGTMAKASPLETSARGLLEMQEETLGS